MCERMHDLIYDSWAKRKNVMISIEAHSRYIILRDKTHFIYKDIIKCIITIYIYIYC